MKDYDVVVIGAGSGLTVAYKALSENMKVALVAREYIGGTCMNVGCVPSKTLLHTADLVMEIEGSRKLGIYADLKSIDFSAIMSRMRDTRKKGAEFLLKDLKESENIDFYETEGQFSGPYTMEAGGEELRAKTIFIASGARPAFPPIRGLAQVPYLTNASLLEIDRLPESIIIVGGSYIGAEYAHFFAAMGSKVSVVEYKDRLISFEEPEISQLLQKSLSSRMEIYTGHEALSVTKIAGGCALAIRERASGKEKVVKGQEILIAAGTESNADRLSVEKTGVELTQAGFIKVNDYLETNVPGIWAIGDATGRGMFTHAADHETHIAWHNAFHEGKKKMDFFAIPHAVFTVPQIASIGLTEELAAASFEIMVGKANYGDIAQSDVRMEHEGFAKAVIDKKTERVLGFHIIGPEAAILIQEVALVVARNESYRVIVDTMHVFPALTELIPETLNSLEG